MDCVISEANEQENDSSYLGEGAGISGLRTWPFMVGLGTCGRVI